MTRPKKQGDRHAAEAAVLVRMSKAERDELQRAVDILNERAMPHGGRYYVGSFMLAGALNLAKKVVAGRSEHVVGKVRT